jgi:hypothetical protein
MTDDEITLEPVAEHTLGRASAIIKHWRRLAKQRARDEQMALIWPPWNALPAGTPPETRRWILTGELVNRTLTRRKRPGFLRGRFPYLPFDKHVFHQALAKAVEWSKLVQYSETTFRLHRELVERQLHFPNFDDVLTGRVAIYRVAKELDLTRPGFLQITAPTLADIECLAQRYADYKRAREDAINLLKPLVFLRRLHKEDRLPPDRQAIGLPHPPETFPNHIYIARLAAFGKCTPKRLAAFFAESFLKLSRQQMNEFCDEFHRPSKWRKGKYVFLAVWLADNAPVFRAFKATWPEILSAAGKLFNAKAPEGFKDCPASPENLKVFWKEYENRLWHGQPRRILPPPGRPQSKSKRSDWQALLTPLPFVPAGKT